MIVEGADLVPPVYAVFSRGIRRIRGIEAFLGGEIFFRPKGPNGVSAVVGWGAKGTANRARRFARRHGLPYLALEDGFLRSAGLGVMGAQPLSLIVDELGVYYDATRASRLEVMLQEGAEFRRPEVMSSAERALALVKRHGLSKYNEAPHKILPENGGRSRVLVIDQTVGDMAVALGMADASTFALMLACAHEENPHAQILIKTHPDVLAGAKRGYLTLPVSSERTEILSEEVCPASLLAQVDRVYTVTSLLGFEALLHGKPVTVFGMPFYAGWGATDDRIRCPRRSVQRSVLEIFAAAYLCYPRYLCPDSGQPGSIFDVIEFLARQRRAFVAVPGRVLAFGFQRWKQPLVAPFFGVPSSRVAFCGDRVPLSRVQPRTGDVVIRWGSRGPEGLDEWAAHAGVPVWRMEDGFLRSVGLGSDLIPPRSLVLDRSGVYYDATRPSDLEQLLLTASFDEALLSRARRLRESIVAARLSKYNTDLPGRWHSRAPACSRVILVPGQVEDDASIRLGGGSVRTNAALLATVREANRDAWIVYRPHPDAAAGNRRGFELLAGLADEVEWQAPLVAMIEAADEIHTMTSLTGFDALLREKRVVVYGAPFYSGWGLTEDRFPVGRRGRSLPLDALVAASLILYPRYWDPLAGGLVEAETVVDRIGAERAELEAGGLRVLRSRLQPSWLKRQWLKGWRWLRLCSQR